MLSKQSIQLDEALASVGKGWSVLVEIAFAYFSGLPAANAIISVDQVKEKFGSLRIYVSFEGEPRENIIFITHFLIHLLEKASLERCEYCGESGWKVSCEKCKELPKTCHQ